MNQIDVKIFRSICLYATAIIVVSSNLINYFYCYKYIGDLTLQWRVAMISIGLSMFTMSAYIWLNESLMGNKLKIIITGWIALFLLISLIGVCIGYDLHTRGFMMILFTIILFGGAHISTRIWQR